MSVRGEAMAAQRRLDSQLKREQVIATVDALLASGRPVSVSAIARRAGVSRKFIYSHPDLRALVERRAREALRADQARATAAGRVTIASLKADAANLKAHNRRLRDQITALELRISQAIGRDVAIELDPLAQEPIERVRVELSAAQDRVFELEEALADTREELDAVREINRELLSAHNRSG